MKVFDYQCPVCKARLKDVLVKDDDDAPSCDSCSEEMDTYVLMVKLVSAPKLLTTIVPTYPGSNKLKAGYTHKFANRPATKTQVGVGGGITKGAIK